MKLPSKTTSLVVIMRKWVLPHPFLDLKPTRKLTIQTGMLHPAQGSTGVLTSRMPDAMPSCARPTARLRRVLYPVISLGSQAVIKWHERQFLRILFPSMLESLSRKESGTEVVY